jgi:hypothetical protein
MWYFLNVIKAFFLRAYSETKQGWNIASGPNPTFVALKRPHIQVMLIN